LSPSSFVLPNRYSTESSHSFKRLWWVMRREALIAKAKSSGTCSPHCVTTFEEGIR
jgi:hypothetical protein